MTKIETLLAEARSLSIAEQRRLAELLLEQAEIEAETDDAATGLRGLRAWTESVAAEDWSAHYPDSLRSPGASAQ
jgi:hypothetical protein